MKSLYLLLPLLIFLTACDGQSPDPPADVQLRVFNASPFDFNAVKVVDIPYGAVPSQSFSEYKDAEMAYRYNYIEAAVLDTVLILQPIDFVGETPLESGFYTYRLDVIDEGTELTLQFIEDE